MSPLVALELWVRAGAREERNAENGAAHFIEHLVFRRGKNFAAETPDTAIENLGATLTAANAPDYTRYSTTIAPVHFAKAAAILSDVVRNAEFPVEEMELERGVILDELAARESRTDEQIQNALYPLLFPGHPYRFSPGGEPDKIKTLTRDILLSFYRRCYRPDRCTLVVVGNIEPAIVGTEVTRIFGNWIAPVSASESLETTSPLSKSALTLYHRNIVPQLGMGFIAPPGGDIPGSYAIQLLSILLEERLQTIRELSEISVRYTPRLSRSLFQIHAKLNISDTNLTVPLDMQERYARVEGLIRAEIGKLKQIPPTQAELSRASRRIIGRYLVDTETDSGLAQFLAYTAMVQDKIGGTPHEFLAQVRPNAITNAAQVLLSSSEGIVHLLPDRSPLPKKEAKP